MAKAPSLPAIRANAEALESDGPALMEYRHDCIAGI